jgi:ribosome biogenesis protein ENP2
MVQATLITSYCLQSQLLSLHVQSLRDKLLQHIISHGDWMPSGIVWLLRFDAVDTATEPINGVSVLNTLLWVLIVVAPFIQATRLTAACLAMRDVGHEVRTRPFVYETTPVQDLDSILLYTSSLRMTSELFKIPVTGRYLCMATTIGTILIITFAQCHVF